MLNMKAMPAAGGAGLADYLWKEAVGIATPDPLEADSFDEAVYQEYAKRLARVEAAGVDDIDHDLLWGKASDDVIAAIKRDDAQHISGIEYRRDTAPELAELLKIDLTAAPQLQDLKHLLSAKAADGSKIAGRLYHPDRADQMTMGSLELIFSADKSVSSVFGLALPEERAAIVAAQSRAVDTAMRQIADKIGVIRSRRGGLDRRDPADLTWVQWQHRMSRLGDPQLHTHVSLLNVVRSRVDGKVGTLDTFLLHGLYPSVRETYHRALADELGKLGLPVQFDAKVPAAVLSAVPDQVLRHFSGRTVHAQSAAEKWLQENSSVNFADLTPRQRSAWLTQMSAKTRPPKSMYYVPGNGHTAWHARAAGIGYVPPPQFISPQALQRAGIAHATMHQRQNTPAQPPPPPLEPPGHRRSRQSKPINPRLDSRHNKGGGYFEDELSRQGRRL